MADLLEGLPEDDSPPPPRSPGESLEKVKPAPVSRKERAQDYLEAITDELYCEALEIISDAMSFADVEPDQLMPGEAPPERWVERYGYQRAERKARVARCGRMPKKDAPYGLQVAMHMASSVQSARAKMKEGPAVLNVQFVQISGPQPVYEVVDVEK